MSEAILQRVARGEPNAVEDCLDQYGNLIWSLARRHAADQDDAEDAVQEIFVDLWRNADRYDPARGSELTFVCTLARRRLIDRHRHRQRRLQPDSLYGPEGTIREIVDLKANQAETCAEAALANQALARLDKKERNVIVLSTYYGMSHGQIASHTGLPLGTVKTYIRRGLMRLHEMLHDQPRIEGMAT